ncbi:hypothetical protein P4I72_10960 [Paenibacillus alba]|uniref:Glycosyl hydrolase family 95 catalytic domain-containing protein n=1 Tax=Paenibacillus alba TaxID=1197127 RepID=A0ABU6G0G6_9BACL|nr:hypothetical protein [Paenibacillus alba]MEC0227645.1 hypothetical protein [Paenibacillus alba]
MLKTAIRYGNILKTWLSMEQKPHYPISALTGGMWLMFNVYDHYRFTQDKTFLRDTAFPLMKGSAEFALDLLVANKDGYLVTSPSTSPETKYVLSDAQKLP